MSACTIHGSQIYLTVSGGTIIKKPLNEILSYTSSSYPGPTPTPVPTVPVQPTATPIPTLPLIPSATPTLVSVSSNTTESYIGCDGLIEIIGIIETDILGKLELWEIVGQGNETTCYTTIQQLGYPTSSQVISTPTPVPTPTLTPFYMREGATPFPSLPTAGTPVPMPEILTSGAYLNARRNTGDPGLSMKLVGANFPKRENIASVWFIPIDPNNGDKIDITPLTKYFHIPSLSYKYQYKHTDSNGVFNELITIPTVPPDLYYIEATVLGNPAKSASMLFRVTGDHQIPTPTPPYPTSTPYPTYTPMPTYTPVPTYIPYPINIIPSPGIYTISSDVHDVYYGPTQICAEDL